MIKIYKPSLEITKTNVKIKSLYEIDNKKNYLWYSFPLKFKNFLITENLDAFFVGLLLLAMQKGHDIKLMAPVSEKLYYTVTNYILKALNLANEQMKIINIYPSKLNSSNLNIGNSACTGLSGGVDSFSTIYEHEDLLAPYKIKYFTFFNAGSHGEFGGEAARKVFNDRLELVKPYAKKRNISIITVDTNLNEILMMNHERTHIIRDISCILNLQKLIKYYYYSSSFRFDFFKDTADYDILMTSMLSTESTNIFSGSSRYTRAERTSIISNYKDTYDFLNVCIASSTSYVVENCSVCLKCLRTELTLDILGKLHLYENVFNINKFYSVRAKYIGELLSNLKNESYNFNKDIFELMKEKNYKIPKKSYLYYFFIKFKIYTKKLLFYIFGEKFCKKTKRTLFKKSILIK
jgi:hypothetical protein